MCAVSPVTGRHAEPKQFGSPALSRRRCNSLPVKILRVSYLQSRIWRHIQSLEIGNPNKTQQLSDGVSGDDLPRFAANSFVCRILLVSNLESGFCSANSSPRRAKLFVIKILSRQDKKRTKTTSLIPLSSLPSQTFSCWLSEAS